MYEKEIENTEAWSEILLPSRHFIEAAFISNDSNLKWNFPLSSLNVSLKDIIDASMKATFSFIMLAKIHTTL